MSIALANKPSQEDADAALEALRQQFPDHQFNMNVDGSPPRFRLYLEGDLGVAKEGEQADSKVVDTPTVDSMRRVASTTLRKDRLEAAQRRGRLRVGSTNTGGRGGRGTAGAGVGTATTGAGAGAGTGTAGA
jgi:hypothetical protein